MLGGVQDMEKIEIPLYVTNMNNTIYNENSTFDEQFIAFQLSLMNKKLSVFMEGVEVFNQIDYETKANITSISDMIDQFPIMFNAHIGSWYDPESVIDTSDNEEGGEVD